MMKKKRTDDVDVIVSKQRALNGIRIGQKLNDSILFLLSTCDDVDRLIHVANTLLLEGTYTMRMDFLPVSSSSDIHISNGKS